MRARLGGAPYRVQDWRDMNRELFSALLLEKIAMFVALAMIITVASFLIVATLVMIVLQRGKEIAILKSMGSSDASIMKVFVVHGLVVGVGEPCWGSREALPYAGSFRLMAFRSTTGCSTSTACPSC
ncbi:MAG: ABC transporter permease [Myxococcales bacterium]|nr:ABC transporter permease [Myxococcales bacterium]